ncbi:MAG: oligoendopeptidase F, partial [Spirochaetia bacterium]|nr:oligoendopeptidase F [Spirochaetia bacterium]
MDSAEIKTRDQIAPEDKWDLSSLFASEADWEKALADMNSIIPTLSRFKGTLGQSAEKLAGCLKAMTEFQILAEKTGSYAMLQFNTDGSDPQNQKRYGLYISAATKAEAETSYLVPEIQAIADDKLAAFMQSPLLADYTIYLSKLLRQKPHILSEKEEKLLALHSESDMTAHKAFSALTDVDMEFGTINDSGVEKPLTQSTFTSFLQSQDRTVRKKAYQQFYNGFDKHKNTIAALYAGNVQLDIFGAKARNYSSALESALAPDNVPQSVYDNLIATMHSRFPVLHRYYELKRQALDLDKLAHYDVYMPFTSAVEVKHTYNEAVDEVIEALKPLGSEYCSILKNGLTGGWVDKYENKGK